MPRTLPAGLQDAINANKEPYFKLWASDVGETPILISNAIITEFVIEPLELSVKFYLKDPDRSPFLNLQIERGRVSNGTPITIKTSTFHAYETKINDEIGLFEARAHIAPEQRISIAGDDTYKNVIDAFCTTIGKTAVYQDPTAPWLDYQFLPDGRSLTLNNGRYFFSFLKQKYLIFAADNGGNEILFSQFKTPTAPDWEIEDIRFYMGESPITRRFLWRDEASTIHYSDASTNPIHNLGYLESTDSPPARATYYEFRTNLLHAPELAYMTTDYADVSNGANIAPNTMLEIIESFKRKQTPAWNIQIKGIPIFTNTEGGTLPSTIEAAAPYTPLNVSNFNGILSADDNNIQAAMETIDDHEHDSAIVEWGTITGNLQDQIELIDILNSKRRVDGWLEMLVQPTRTAADDPTYTLQFTGVDYRGNLAEGTPVTWLQNDIIRYGYINSEPIYSGGNTTVTVLTRLDSSSTDYDVLDTGTYAITFFSVALPKQPGLGFPALPQYWTTSLVDSSNQNVSTPGTGIVNPGSLSLTVPIGAWRLEAEFIVWVEYSGTNTRHSVFGGIGTTTSSFYSDMQYYFLATSTDIIANGGYTIAKEITYTSKTTLYINVRCATVSPATSLISLRGGTRDTELHARSLYL